MYTLTLARIGRVFVLQHVQIPPQLTWGSEILKDYQSETEDSFQEHSLRLYFLRH